MKIKNAKVAIIATHGFEETELTAPRDSLRKAGAVVHVVSPEAGEIQGFRHFDKGEKVKVDRALDEIDGDDYDALVIPGGLFNPDQIRVNEKAISLVRDFVQNDKPVAAICHGPWLLINAGVVRNRLLTSVPTIRADLHNAGAMTVDQAVAVDGNLITSRTPKDLPVFCDALLRQLEKHEPARKAA